MMHFLIHSFFFAFSFSMPPHVFWFSLHAFKILPTRRLRHFIFFPNTSSCNYTFFIIFWRWINKSRKSIYWHIASINVFKFLFPYVILNYCRRGRTSPRARISNFLGLNVFIFRTSLYYLVRNSFLALFALSKNMNF